MKDERRLLVWYVFIAVLLIAGVALRELMGF